MKTAIKTLFAAAACAALGAAHADVKTDGQWRGNAGAALSATSGNTDSTTFLLNADMVNATTTGKISLGGNYNYGRSKLNGVSSTTADKWNAFGQYDYNLSPRAFVFGKLGFEGDRIEKLDLRSTLAGGAGYKLVDTKENTFTLFGGVGYSTDRYSAAQTIGSSTGTTFSRTSLYLAEESSHQLSATTAFKQRLEYYPGISGDKANLARFGSGLTVAMSGTLSLNVGVTDSYNSRPPTGQKSNDIGIFTGINVKLGAN